MSRPMWMSSSKGAGRNDLPVNLTSDIDADFQSATGNPGHLPKHSDLGKIRNDAHTQRDVSTSFKR